MPPGPVTISVTVNDPGELKVCCVVHGPVWSMVPLLSKSHAKLVISPPDAQPFSETIRGVTPESGWAVSTAIGGGGNVAEITLLTVEVPPGPVTDSPTVWFPAVVNVWVAVGPLASSKTPSASRSHATESTSPVDVLVRSTVRGTVPDGGSAVNEATGAGGLMLTVWVSVSVPPGPVTVRVTT